MLCPIQLVAKLEKYRKTIFKDFVLSDIELNQ